MDQCERIGSVLDCAFEEKNKFRKDESICSLHNRTIKSCITTKIGIALENIGSLLPIRIGVEIDFEGMAFQDLGLS